MKKSVLVSIMLFLYVQVAAQKKTDKWMIGVGVTAVDFYPTKVGNSVGLFNEITNARDHWSISGPRIHAARHVTGKFSVDLGLSFNSIGKVGDIELTKKLKYVAFDVAGQYAFLTAEKTIQPYVFVGTGYTILNKNGAITMNAGLGSSVWLNDSVGINLQGVYKHTSDTNLDVAAHFIYSATLIMSISGFLGNRGHGSRACYY
ncbi:MAG: hypothetical protein JKY08_09860 [Flavobacteriaceae bacterium]|nr:hypothetical protein [Flavobacteriaceae bacterium]